MHLLCSASLGGAEALTLLPALMEVYASMVEVYTSKLLYLLCSACLGRVVSFTPLPALMKLWAGK